MNAATGTPAGTAHRSGRTRGVLISVIGLHLVAETALTPFLPQLFDRLYGIEDPQATGWYVWLCRLVGLGALPLWGLAARRHALHRLVLAGLCGSTVFDLLLALAPSYAVHTGISMAVVATNSALLLAYPAFIAEYGGAPDGDGESRRLAGVRTVVVVFHLSVVVATLVGAGVLALPQPRIGIAAFAVIDALLAWLTYRVLHRPHPVVTGRQATARQPVRRRAAVLLIAQVALIAVAFDFSVNVVRPFFTEYAEEFGAASPTSAVLFFLPSVSALAVLPLAGRCHRALGGLLLPAAMAVGAAGLAWQSMAGTMTGLVGGRLLFGVGLGLGQVAVELRMFRATGTKGPAFAAVETARAAALLAAPVAASATVSRDLALPLALGALLQLAGAVLALGTAGTRPAADPVPAVPPPAPDPDPVLAATTAHSEEIPR